jgi:hypothetical protein
VAIYKYLHYLTHSQEEAYEVDHRPGDAAPFAGIYRCMGCHTEEPVGERQPLPPHNHHPHTPTQGAIRWRLIVYADHRPK